MQSFLSGGDKGGSSNPLNQISKREGADNSVFKDRLSTPSGSSSQLPFRPVHNQRPQQHTPINTPHPFNLSHLSSALAHTQIQPLTSQSNAISRSSPAPQFNAEWDRASSQRQLIGAPRASNFSQEYVTNHVTGGSAWTGDFQSSKGKGRAIDSPPTQPQYHQQQFVPQNGHQYQPFQPRFQPMYQSQSLMGGVPLGGVAQNGRLEVIDHKGMEEAFERALNDARELSQVGVAENREVAVEGDGVEEIDAKGDLEAVWESLRPEAERLGKLAEWENDFSQFTSGEDDTFDILNESLNRDDVGQTGLDEQLHFDGAYNTGRPFEAEIREMRPYEFQPQQASQPNPQEAWIEAKHILETGGSLSQAADLVETFLQTAQADDYHSQSITRVDAWATLGRIQAMNEKEEKALSAFEEGRRLLEQREGQGVAGELLTDLAISYVNESLDLEALQTLHQYLTILYPTHAGQQPTLSSLEESSTNPWKLHQQLVDSFLSIATGQYQAGQGGHGKVDPYVQVGLGTLYYTMGDYESARNCWVAALGEKPDDYLLWNRLGATLANGGNPEEAVDAYRRALELKPTFTRAISNLGVACLNIGVYREAAEHFLAALSLHPQTSPSDSTSSNDSVALWSTLRRSLVGMDLHALAGMAHPGTDLEVFRKAGFDF